MALFNRHKQAEPVVPEVQDDPDLHNFGFLDDLMPHEAFEMLGLDPNGDPNVIVPKAIAMTQKDTRFGLFDMTQGQGEYLMYQSPQGRLAYRFLQNPLAVADMKNPRDYMKAAPDMKAWDKGWMTPLQWSENYLTNTSDPSMKPFTDFNSDDIPEGWLRTTEPWAIWKNPEEYQEKLAERHDRQARRRSLILSGQYKYIPPTGNANSLLKSERVDRE